MGSFKQGGDLYVSGHNDRGHFGLGNKGAVRMVSSVTCAW